MHISSIDDESWKAHTAIYHAMNEEDKYEDGIIQGHALKATTPDMRHYKLKALLIVTLPIIDHFFVCKPLLM